MRFSAGTALITALAPLVHAQQDSGYLQGLLQALTTNNLTSLASVAGTINGTSEGQTLLASLSQGNNTVFAPSNDAFAAVPSQVSSNASALAAILSYHVVIGNFSSTTSNYPNVTIGRTFLDQPSYVNLEGNKSQVLAWSNIGGKNTVLNQASNVTVTNTATYQNLNIYVIDSVLAIPGNITTVVTSLQLTSLASVVSMIPFTSATGANETLLDVFSNASGYTIFAPDNSAFVNAAGTLSSLQNNQSAMATVLQNHVINGTSAYSPLLLSGSNNYVSAAGEPFSFSSNSSGVYVTNGASSAKIIKTDVLVSNGVIHVIDSVLADLQSNPAAASSAYASATSVAAQSSTETGPVGIVTGTPKPKSGALKSGAGLTTGVVAVLAGVIVGGGWVVL